MSDVREWKRLRTGLPADYTILKVREDTVAHPGDQSEHPRVIIECPDWVNIIPVTLEEEVVLVKQFRFGVWQPSLEIPGGMVDPGETPLDAAVRELEEETGYVPGRVIELGWVHPNPAIQTNKCHSYLALGCTKEVDAAPEAGEDIVVERVKRKQIAKMLREGKITHSLVVAAFMLERLYWDKETAYAEE